MNTASSAANGLVAIGKGIGAIFLLFVIFYYVSAMLDGGKFQTKMLWPLLVFVIVCNFGLFASPVLSFVQSLQKGCIDVCKSRKESIKTSMGADSDASILSIFWQHAKLEAEQSGESALDEEAIVLIEENEAGNGGSTSFNGGTGATGGDAGGGGRTSGEGTAEGGNGSGGITFVYPTDQDSNTSKVSKAKGLKGLGNAILKCLQTWENKLASTFMDGFNVGRNAFKSAAVYIKYGAVGILAAVCQFIASVASILMILFGGVMMAVVVAFGPITFAFGIFPGNGRVIGSWCIRLCQFALYSPIAYMVDTFSLALAKMLINNDGQILLVLALLLCNIALLFSIPGIASMIIEGASGSVSLSQGLTSMSQWGSTAMRVAGSPLKGMQAYRDFFERKRDNKEMDILRSINDATGGNPEYGLNPKKGKK